MKRRPSRKLLTAAAANRRFARKQLDWINAYNSGCEVATFIPDEEGCPNGVVVPLVNASYVRNHCEDKLIVRRMLGNLYFRPTMDPTNPADVEEMTCYLRLALKKWELPNGAQDPLIYNPLRGLDLTDDPDDEGGDFTDMESMHQWELHWAALSVRDLHTNITGYWQPRLELCGVGTLACIEPQELNDGNGFTWGAGPTGTEHVPIKLGGVWHPCPDSQCETPGETNGYQAWAWKKISFDMKFRRGITLEGNQFLSMFGGFENLAVTGGTRPLQPTMYMFGGIRLQVER